MFKMVDECGRVTDDEFTSYGAALKASKEYVSKELTSGSSVFVVQVHAEVQEIEETKTRLQVTSYIK